MKYVGYSEKVYRQGTSKSFWFKNIFFCFFKLFKIGDPPGGGGGEGEIDMSHKEVNLFRLCTFVYARNLFCRARSSGRTLHALCAVPPRRVANSPFE